MPDCIDLSPQPKITEVEIFYPSGETILRAFTGQETGNLVSLCYEGEGGRRFQKFVETNPDYHPFHTSIPHISQSISAIVSEIEDTKHLIVVGGSPLKSFTEKEMQIIARLPGIETISLIDVDERGNEEIASFLRKHFHDANSPITVFTYTSPFTSASLDGSFQDVHPATVLQMGSLISNPVNFNAQYPKGSIRTSLEHFKRLAGPGGKILIEYDTNIIPEELDKAYGTKELEEFFLDGLADSLRACHAKGLNMDCVRDYFTFEREFHPAEKRYEHRFVCIQDFDVELNGQILHLKKGQKINAADCVKYDSPFVTQVGYGLDVRTQGVWINGKGLALHVMGVQP